MPKLTRRFIEREIVPPEHGQRIYRDSELPGFGLRVTRGSKSFIVECRVRGINCRRTVGRYGVLTMDEARRKARLMLGIMAASNDPVVISQFLRPQSITISLGEVLEEYLRNKRLRPSTIKRYRQITHRCIGDWLHKPITAISPQMVEDRHRELGTKITRQGTSGTVQANMAMRVLGILLNYAASSYETADGRPIIPVNPIKRLSQYRCWYPEPRRQTVIPDCKLGEWYQAVNDLSNPHVRDYLLVLILTGLRRNEAASLKWTDIDWDSNVLFIRAELAKNKREHRLPLSKYLLALLRRRRKQLAHSESAFVFPGRGSTGHMVDSYHVISGVGRRISCPFVIHDLRRTFLTVAERLDVPYYALKRLANHAGSGDVTFGYIVVDVERLRPVMEKITASFLKHFGVRSR